MEAPTYFEDDAVWKEGTGSEKEMTYAGKIMKAGKLSWIEHAQYSQYNMTLKRVSWVAARNDRRRKICQAVTYLVGV